MDPRTQIHRKLTLSSSSNMQNGTQKNVEASREGNPEKEVDLVRICRRNATGVLLLESGNAGHAKDATQGPSG